jgi:hypothetical protein
MPKIIGNTTATPNPRPDWNQTDETKADYIKNKPTLATVATTGSYNDLTDLPTIAGVTGNNGVYVGSGDMPEGSNVKINPKSAAVEEVPEIKSAYFDNTGVTGFINRGLVFVVNSDNYPANATIVDLSIVYNDKEYRIGEWKEKGLLDDNCEIHLSRKARSTTTEGWLTVHSVTNASGMLTSFSSRITGFIIYYIDTDPVITVKDTAGNMIDIPTVGLLGSNGSDGKSAYQYAVDGGYEGTEEEFGADLAKAVEGGGDGFVDTSDYYTKSETEEYVTNAINGTLGELETLIDESGVLA